MAHTPYGHTRVLVYSVLEYRYSIQLLIFEYCSIWHTTYSVGTRVHVLVYSSTSSCVRVDYPYLLEYVHVYTCTRYCTIEYCTRVQEYCQKHATCSAIYNSLPMVSSYGISILILQYLLYIPTQYPGTRVDTCNI